MFNGTYTHSTRPNTTHKKRTFDENCDGECESDDRQAMHKIMDSRGNGRYGWRQQVNKTVGAAASFISFATLNCHFAHVITMDFPFSLLADDMIERNQNVVTMHDVSPLALRQLIDYAYSGEITITEDNVQVRRSVVLQIFDRHSFEAIPLANKKLVKCCVRQTFI